MSLQYFHFETPQKVLVWNDGIEDAAIALGYWQNVDELSSNPHYNLAEGEALPYREISATNCSVYFSTDEVNS